jgi:HipA N-terminal domain
VSYVPQDQLFLWLLTRPEDPVLIGELNTVRTQRGVSLRYADEWLERGFALSEDLPLLAEEFLPEEKDTAAGAVDDARPARWGERVIRLIDKPSRLSLMEYLYFAGDDRFGALGVSTSQERYAPRRGGPVADARGRASAGDTSMANTRMGSMRSTKSFAHAMPAAQARSASAAGTCRRRMAFCTSHCSLGSSGTRKRTSLAA